ncbi:MAG TPA: hypothetical protein VH041_08405 [Caldimonas sp.]|jgi:hypothetical protein|nr:hypothetical protein [Caldimonas sp.]HEX4234317.1 hypothetical protein [Caldimonas sp.]
MGARPATVRLLVFAAGVLALVPGTAQEFGVYLKCSGQVQAGDRAKNAHLDLALRRNSSLALIQSSDVLPVGDKMKLDITPGFYSMVFHAPARNSAVYYDWIRGTIFVWNPILRELQTVRISVDRQTAALEGDMRDVNDHSIGHLKMRCTPSNNDSAPEPKF